MAALRDRLCGVLGFPATPFHSDLSLDLDALEQNAAEMAKHPFCALVAAGGMGEVYSLSPDEIEAVVHVTVKAAAGRMPVIAGVGFNVPIACELARRFEQAGVEGLLVLPPYYLNAPEEGLLDYYRHIGNATGLPLIGYSRDWAVFTPQQVARLADAVPTLGGWKDGQGDMRRLHRIMAYNGDRLAWLGGIGDDCVTAYFAIGVRAYTSSLSNVAPKLALALTTAALAGDYALVNRLVTTYVHPLYAIRERSRGFEIAVIKAAMEILGRGAGPVRPPLANCRPADLADIRTVLAMFGDFVEEREPGLRAERSASGAGGKSLGG
jgi:5-dehydro-4-deoxyglucarate dehydratase